MAEEENIFPSIEDQLTGLDDNSIFEPIFIDPVDDLEQVTEDTPIPYGFTWKFDFSKGDIFFDSQFSAKKLTKLDSLNDWIGHTLNTIRFETPSLGSDIGTDIPDLIGRSVDDYMITRIEMEIREALLTHDRIVSVNVIEVFNIEGSLYSYFEYSTDDSLSNESLIQLA